MNEYKANEIRKQIVRVREGYSAIALVSTMLASAGNPSHEDALEISDLIADAIEAGYDRALRQYAGTYLRTSYKTAGDRRHMS